MSRCDGLQDNTDRECYDLFHFSNEYGASTALVPARISTDHLFEDFSFPETALEDWVNLEQSTSRSSVEFNATNLRDDLPANQKSVPEQGRGYIFSPSRPNYGSGRSECYDPWLSLPMEEGGGLALDCGSSVKNNFLFQFSSDIDVGATEKYNQASTSSLDNEGLPRLNPIEHQATFQLQPHAAPSKFPSLLRPGDDSDTSFVTNGAPNIQYSIGPSETNRMPLARIARLKCPKCT